MNTETKQFIGNLSPTTIACMVRDLLKKNLYCDAHDVYNVLVKVTTEGDADNHLRFVGVNHQDIPSYW